MFNLFKHCVYLMMTRPFESFDNSEKHYKIIPIGFFFLLLWLIWPKWSVCKRRIKRLFFFKRKLHPLRSVYLRRTAAYKNCPYILYCGIQKLYFYFNSWKGIHQETGCSHQFQSQMSVYSNRSETSYRHTERLPRAKLSFSGLWLQ